MRLQPFYQSRISSLSGDMQQGLPRIIGQSLNKLVAALPNFAASCVYVVFVDAFSYSRGVSTASCGENFRAKALELLLLSTSLFLSRLLGRDCLCLLLSSFGPLSLLCLSPL